MTKPKYRQLGICIVFSVWTTLPVLANRENSLCAAFTPDPEEFAAKFFEATLPEFKNQNFVLSPYGVSQTLGLISLGAEGATRVAFNAALGFATNACRSFVSETFSEWNKKLASKNGENVRLLLSNSLWIAPEFKLKGSFAKLTGDVFGAGVKQVEMGLPAQRTINEYVASKTGGMIRELLKDPPDPETELIAVNTVYLDAKWESPFQKASTGKRPFSTPGGEKKVDFMHQTGRFKIYKDNLCKILFLPYCGNMLEMAVILPEKNAELRSLKNRFSGRILCEISKSAETKSVQIALPKFEVTSSIDLKMPLLKMGLGIAFSDRADFSGISDIRLSISKAEQVAKIRVDEDGTEAAAATYIAMIRCSLIHPDEEFLADRPFLFALRDKETSDILFAGMVSEP